jgi:hypothetical protein
MSFSGLTPWSTNSMVEPATRSFTVLETSTARLRGDARAHVHCDAADLLTDQLALTGVQARPHLDPELAHRHDLVGKSDVAALRVTRLGLRGNSFALREQVRKAH